MDKEALIKDFDKWVSTKVRNTTKKNYVSQVKLFLSYYDINDAPTFVRLGLKEKGTYLGRCYIRKFAILKFLEFLSERGINVSNIIKEVTTIKTKVPERVSKKTFDYNDALMFINKLANMSIDEIKSKYFKPNARIKDENIEQLILILMLIIDTGARIRAILRLRASDVIALKNKEKISYYVSLYEKRGKSIDRIITKETYVRLRDYIVKTGRDYLFLSGNEVKRIDDALYNRYNVMLGLFEKITIKELGEKISFHWLRRGVARYWYDRMNKDIVEVQKFFCHESVETTRRYLKLSAEKIDEEMKKEKRPW